MAIGTKLVEAQQQTQGKIDFKQSLDDLKNRFNAIKEKRAKRDHPAFADAGEEFNGMVFQSEYHCAYNRYNVGCFDFTGELPKGVPRQRTMDSLFHELENTPPVELIEDYIDEAERWVGEQAMKAKEYAIQKLKSCMKEIADRAEAKLKEITNFQSVMDSMGGKELKELIQFMWDILTGKISLDTICKIVENLIKLILKTIWRSLKRMYEPYLQVLLLILWTVKVVVTLLELVVDRIQKVMQLLSRIASIQIQWPVDNCPRCTMKISSSNPNAEVEKALHDAQTDMAYMNGQISTLELISDKISSAVKDAETSPSTQNALQQAANEFTSKGQQYVNNLVGSATSQLSGIVASATSQLPFQSVKTCLAEMRKLMEMDKVIDKMIDSFAEAIGTLCTAGLNKLKDAMDKIF